MPSLDVLVARYSKSLATAGVNIEEAVVQHNLPPYGIMDRLWEANNAADSVHEEVKETKASLASSIMKSWMTARIAVPIAGLVGRIAWIAATAIANVARVAIFSVAKLLARVIVVPLISAISTVVLSPPGVLIFGSMAAGAALYYGYKWLFGESAITPKIGDDVRDTPSAPSSRAGFLAGSQGRAQMTAGERVSSYSARTYTPDATATGRLKKRSLEVKAAIQKASEITGFSVHTLTAFAYKESTFNPGARPIDGGVATSSAKGLFQFITGTWNSTVRRYGERYGVPLDADPYDPLYNAIMAGAYLKHDIYPAISKVVPNPTATDLYFGHFMGPGGGPAFLRKLAQTPHRIAAYDFPAAARANRWVYKTKSGTYRTYAQIYDMFDRELRAVELESIAETQAASQSLDVAEPVVVTPPAPAPTKQSAQAGESRVSQQKKKSPEQAFHYGGVAFGV